MTHVLVDTTKKTKTNLELTDQIFLHPGLVPSSCPNLPGVPAGYLAISGTSLSIRKYWWIIAAIAAVALVYLTQEKDLRRR